jgi:hypothetical protein
MNRLTQIIKDVLSSPPKKDCGCGCHGKCATNAPMLNENLGVKVIITENMKYHIDNKKPITENTFRYGSKAFLDLWTEARYLYSRDAIDLSESDKQIILETHLGERGLFNGELVPLDLPMEDLNEAEFKGKEVQLGKPKRGGSKKFFVYVKDPKTKKVKKVSFGDTTGLSAKINNPKARKAFAARHKCGTGEPKTSAKYWSCRLPRYASLLGLKNSFSGFW